MRGGFDVNWILVIALGISILVAYFSSKSATQEKQTRIKTERDLSETRKEHAEHIATLASQRTQEITALMEQYTGQITALKTQQTEQLAGVKAQYDKALDHMRGLEKIVDERKIQFPWLASAIADFHALEAERDAQELETKKRPAIKAAAEVREHGGKRRDAERIARRMRYRVEYYEQLFPWLTDYVGDDVPDDAVQASETAEPSDDPVKMWLTEAEYKNLSTAEKNQMALDRWKQKRKRSNWEIGRDYERFIGYNYETLGYDVLYTGAVQGFEDMGRDLIARRQSELRVIQCKYWSQDKTIHEKHIFQLFGSALEYAFRLGRVR